MKSKELELSQKLFGILYISTNAKTIILGYYLKSRLKSSLRVMNIDYFFLIQFSSFI